MNDLLAFVAKFAFGKQLVQGVAFLHDSLEGHKSEILLFVLAVVHGLKWAHVLDSATAGSVEAPLLGALPVTLAQKFSRAAALADKVVPAP